MHGNLRDVSTTQLLNIINLAGKTGTLILFEALKTGENEKISEDEEREKIKPGKERAKVAFKAGKLIHASLDGQDGSIVSVLSKAGKLTDSQARIIRDRAKGVSDKAIALKLIGANYVTQKDIISSIQQYTLDIVYNLMSWAQEPFRFENNVLPDGERIMVPIDLENVIMEGARRVEKFEELNRFLPDLDRSLKFPPNLKEKVKGVHLSVEEWRVVSFVNPKNTIRQIARANNMSDIEIRRVVYGLVQAGLVEVVLPASARLAPTSKAGRAQQQRGTRVQSDVVNKLINKIKSM